LKFLAFDNTWHIIALVWGLLLIRVIVPRMPSLRSQRAGILEIVDSLLVAVLLVFLILRPFVVQAFYIPSGSMEHTLEINDRILVNKFLYFFREPQRGDIVVFVSPPNADPDQKDFIKRVIGLPGDRLSVHGGYLWRNGLKVVEPSYERDPATGLWTGAPGPGGYCIADPMYYDFPSAPEGTVAPNGDYDYQSSPLDPTRGFDFQITHGEYVVPPGYIFAMGDNRNESNDSHVWGPLPRQNVLGKAFCIFFPPERVRLLK
jgi:signal peptidase I